MISQLLGLRLWLSFNSEECSGMTSTFGRLGPAAASLICPVAVDPTDAVSLVLRKVGAGSDAIDADSPEDPVGPDLDPGEAGIEDTVAWLLSLGRKDDDEEEEEEDDEEAATPKAIGEAGVDEVKLAEPLVGRVFETTFECVLRREAAPKRAGRDSVLMECML